MWSLQEEGCPYGGGHMASDSDYLTSLSLVPNCPTVTGSQATQQGPEEGSTQNKKVLEALHPVLSQCPHPTWDSPGQGPWLPLSSDCPRGRGPGQPSHPGAPGLPSGAASLLRPHPTWTQGHRGRTQGHVAWPTNRFRGHSCQATWLYCGSGSAGEHSSRGSFGPALLSPKCQASSGPGYGTAFKCL